MAKPLHSRDLSGLSTGFYSALEGLSHQWGFVVVRTAYAAENDEAQWSAALSKLRTYAAPDDDNAKMHPDTFALPLIADSTILCGADYASVRKAFNGWVKDFIHRERRLSDDNIDDYDEEWPSDICRDAFIVIDEPALASLLKAPDLGKAPNLDLEPWVVVLDAEDPKSVPYGGGGPYMGFTRVCARLLEQLFEDLGSRSLETLSPVREYDGQIPLFNGSSKGKLVDPASGVHGRYRFPQGTPRGVDGARAMLEEIERAIGKADAILY